MLSGPHWLKWLLLARDVRKHRPALDLLGAITALTWKQRVALLAGLARDPRLPLRVRLLPLLVVAYLASPIDLVPDFVPVLGQLDDIAFARWVLHVVSTSVSADLLREHVRRVTAAL